MNTCLIQTQHFLLQLIRLYSLIKEQLPSSEPTIHPPSSLDALSKNIVACNAIDRGVRRQNQLQLFRETYVLVKQYGSNNKQSTVKKSEIAMKFTLVSQVLASRLQEQLLISSEIKHDIVKQIQATKEQFLKWAEHNKEKNDRRSKNRKETEKYILKYVFTENPKPTVPIPARCESPFAAPASSQITKVPFKSKSIKNILEQQPRDTAKKRYNKQRKTETITRPTSFSRNKKTSKTVKQSATTSPHLVIEPEVIELSNTDQTSASQEWRQKDEGQSLNFFKKSKKQLTIQSSLNDKSQRHSPDEIIEDKKSKFFPSQNYLKSRKTIDSVSLLASRMKKRSGCNTINKEVSECDEPSDESNYQQDAVLGETDSFRNSKQFFTRRHIPGEHHLPQPIKSQKMLPKSSAAVLKGLISRNSQRSSQRGSVTKSRRSKGELSFFSNNHKDSSELKKSNFCPLNIDGAQVQIANEQKLEEPSPSQGNLKLFYNQLRKVSSQIRQDCDPWFQEFSVFFWQQHLLSENENRKVQKILANRKNQYYTHEFDMTSYSSKKQRSAGALYHEDAYVVAMRGHLSQCQELGQTSLQSAS